MKRVEKITYTVPYMDMVLRIGAWTISGPDGGATNNTQLIVVSVFNFYAHSIVKFSVYPFVWARATFLAAKMVARKKDLNRSNAGSSADAKLARFRTKMHVFVGLYLICNILNLNLTLRKVLELQYWMPSVEAYIKFTRTLHPLAYGLALEILYFSVIERIANAMDCLKKTSRSIRSTLHRRSEGESTEKGIELGGSQSRDETVVEGDLRFTEKNPMWKDKA